MYWTCLDFVLGLNKDVTISAANISLVGGTGESPTVSVRIDGTPVLTEGYINGGMCLQVSHVCGQCHVIVDRIINSSEVLRATYVLQGMLYAYLNVNNNFTVATCWCYLAIEYRQRSTLNIAWSTHKKRKSELISWNTTQCKI